MRRSDIHWVSGGISEDRQHYYAVVGDSVFAELLPPGDTDPRWNIITYSGAQNATVHAAYHPDGGDFVVPDAATLAAAIELAERMLCDEGLEDAEGERVEL